MALLDNLPECVSMCWELLHSEAFFLLLSNFTGLRLHYLCPSDDEEEQQKKQEKVEEGEASGSSAETSSVHNRKSGAT